MAMLKKQGIPFTPKTLGCDNTYQIWLSDPDGNPFEIYCDNPDFDWREKGLTLVQPLNLDQVG
jgi:hypothetical protein